MKVELWVIGKTRADYLREGNQHYAKRIRHYLPFNMVEWPEIKPGGKVASQQVKEKESALILSKLQPNDLLILLDERGQSLTSEKFARFIDRKMQMPQRRMIFLVGGAWGFSEALYQRAQEQISLSEMTFTHQMVRLFFLEQLYRAMTILRNEPYHNS